MLQCLHTASSSQACKSLYGQDPNKDYVSLAENKHSVLNHSVLEWVTYRENETHQSLPKEELL